MTNLRRTPALALLVAASIFIVPRASAQQHAAQRLILKDGSYQEVSKYEIKGDRVRYMSAERDEWEELPSSLVDWPATEKYEKERSSSSVPEAAELDRQFKADQKVDIVVLRKGKKETLKDVAIPASREPENPFRRIELGNPLLQNIFPPEAFGGGDARQSFQMVNGEFTIKVVEDGVSYKIVGTKDDGAAKATSIVVDDNGKTIKADSVEKLDAQYRPMVERILKRMR